MERSAGGNQKLCPAIVACPEGRRDQVLLGRLQHSRRRHEPAENTKGIGKDGYNGKKKTGYDPMCSKGPGVKEYHLTVYALSAEPKFANEKVTRADLLAAIKDITVAQGTMSFKYERPAEKIGN